MYAQVCFEKGENVKNKREPPQKNFNQYFPRTICGDFPQNNSHKTSDSSLLPYSPAILKGHR